MPNHYVSRIDNIIIVTVVYDCDEGAIQTPSFGLMAKDTEVVWNLVVRGSDCVATFGSRPIQAIDSSESLAIVDLRRVSDTQARANLRICGQKVGKLAYEIEVEVAGKGQVTHDPSIIVSHDPVEIP